MNTNTGGIIIDNVALTATVNSAVVNIERCHVCSLDVKTTSGSDTAAGIIVVQVCNDISIASPNWVAVAFTDGTSTSSSVSYDLSAAEVTKFFNLENLGAKYLRVQVTASSTGAADTIRVVAHVKNRN